MAEQKRIQKKINSFCFNCLRKPQRKIYSFQRHGWMDTHGCIAKMTNPCEPVSTFNKRLFYLDYSELCNFKRAGPKRHISICITCRAGARTLIGGVYIHIFRFCRLVSFVIKLISKEISRA